MQVIAWTSVPKAKAIKYIDVKAVDPYVDFVNIMAYDLVDAPASISIEQAK